MDFSLTDEQKMLKESAERFIERDYTFAARRELAAGELGFGRENWARFAELGWLAVALPEAHGGLGGSLLDVAVLMEAFGRGLVVEPYVPSVVLGGGLVALAGAEAQKDALLPPLAEGRLMLALAHGEPQSRFNLADVETTAKETTSGDGGYVLDGHKCVVLNAAAADRIVVSARTSGAARQPDGITLFLVDRQADGVVLRPYATQDGRRAAEVGLVGVRVGSGDVLGAVGGGLPLVERVVDDAIVAVAAEAVGAMEALIAATREYLKTRQQFGVPIGDFQVLQHRVVDMFMACELSRALTYRAAASPADGGARARGRAASALKVRIGEAGKLVGQQAVQLHGAMGMTDELDVGHYFKRLTMIGALFGDAGHHLERFVALGGAATGQGP
ncbi:MAG: acyl-CoA dehydrogenase [Rhodospirillales bacterium]|jgi:alkylation response protein AidB-like acyl-CoA dehydrogenase|nr:acyl-CoA dehydrogenase [Rhodospirillales bacterium]HJO73390.1 acyl-CoA dehydrogenase [Rhodospirillales bacterium]